MGGGTGRWPPRLYHVALRSGVFLSPKVYVFVAVRFHLSYAI